jgi:hypothetical protein
MAVHDVVVDGAGPEVGQACFTCVTRSSAVRLPPRGPDQHHHERPDGYAGLSGESGCGTAALTPHGWRPHIDGPPQAPVAATTAHSRRSRARVGPDGASPRRHVDLRDARDVSVPRSRGPGGRPGLVRREQRTCGGTNVVGNNCSHGRRAVAEGLSKGWMSTGFAGTECGRGRGDRGARLRRLSGDRWPRPRRALRAGRGRARPTDAPRTTSRR